MYLLKEMEYLENSMMHMADLVVNNLTIAFDAYLNYQPKDYIINDDIIDNQEIMIEGECLHILLKERPYASDLRKVTGILKLISDLERLGDHAEDILEFALKLKNTEKHSNEIIGKMVKDVLHMVKDSIESYIKKDEALAQSVINRDDKIDETYEKIINELIRMQEEKISSPSFCVYSTLVVKYIERIADHAVNIAKWVIYIISGIHKENKMF